MGVGRMGACRGVGLDPLETDLEEAGRSRSIEEDGGGGVGGGWEDDACASVLCPFD